MPDVQDHNSQWVFVTPIFNLTLTEAVNHEYELERVTFISSDKFLRIRDRLGITRERIVLIDDRLDGSGLPGISSYLSSYDTLAVLRQSGTPRQIKSKCYRMVQDELNILALSQLYYQNRRFTGFVGLAGEHDRSSASHVFIDSQNLGFVTGSQLLRSPLGLKLDQDWIDYHDQLFFFRLVKLLNGKISVSSQWRADIRRACILIGKSINTSYVADAFLWNMIALELLLTQQGDTYSTDIPNRLQALIGWTGLWESESYEDKIKAIYKLRCKYVHDGNSDRINKDALLFSDKLVFNALWNLVSHSSHFGSKNDLIEWVKKVDARRFLGMPQLKTPKLKFANKLYTAQDLQDV